MMHPVTPIGAMLIYDRERAVREIVAAIRACKGNVKATAAQLKVSQVTIFRWIGMLPELGDAIAIQRSKHGYATGNPNHRRKKKAA